MKNVAFIISLFTVIFSTSFAIAEEKQEDPTKAAEKTMQAKNDEYTIIIQEHKFSPSELTIPANKKVKLIVDNQDATPEEFESHDLKREKVIPGHKKGVINIGPLKPGEYKFVGEFNEKTAQGVIKVQ